MVEPAVKIWKEGRRELRCDSERLSNVFLEQACRLGDKVESAGKHIAWSLQSSEL